MRLDEMLVARGLFASRSRARDAVLRGTVSVGGAVAGKAGQPVGPDDVVAVDDAARTYVSRAALKLAAGLDAFAIDVAGRTVLDLGASTGGFTQVLLERGAAHVVAVDVGHGQLAATLRDDPRVTLHEGLNVRDLQRVHLGGRAAEAVVADLSFISLRIALPAALSLAEPGAAGVFLVKPQFEAGRAALGKAGVLRDPALAERVAVDLARWLGEQPGWRSLGIVPSPIFGGDGNREFLLAGRRDT